MDVKHCPSCGSADIDVSSWSAEYRGGTYYTCENCGWKYHSGRGMGTGSGNSGKHPASFDNGGNQKLVPVGEWCSTCDTCATPGNCKCVNDGEVGWCEECAKFSDKDETQMDEVQTYFGRHQPSPFECHLCGDKAELKTDEHN